MHHRLLLVGVGQVQRAAAPEFGIDPGTLDQILDNVRVDGQAGRREITKWRRRPLLGRQGKEPTPGNQRLPADAIALEEHHRPAAACREVIGD